MLKEASDKQLNEYVLAEEKLHASEVAPNKIVGVNIPDWSSFLMGVFLPLSLGILMNTISWLLYANLTWDPPFGVEMIHHVRLSS